MSTSKKKEPNLTLLTLRMRQLRKDRKWKQSDVAKRLGVTVACISNYENGIIVPSFTKLQELSKIFEVPVSYITGESTNKNYEEDLPYIDVDEYLGKLIKELNDPSSTLKYNRFPIPKEARDILQMNLEHTLAMLRNQLQSFFTDLVSQEK